MTPMVASTIAQDEPSGLAPEDIWSDNYIDDIFPWAPASDDILQFKQYHTYETMKTRMMRLAEENPDIFEYHEGMNGGTNARGEEVTADAYEGWYYGHLSPWMKITANVQGGEYNEFVGDNGNYADRHDVMIVGNHHAREWMSYEVPMLQLEVIAFSYNNIGYDNDGDGLVDEDSWGDTNGDGILDDDGDCLALAAEHQDSNGDGVNCGPGDHGVDEDYSEQFITDLVNAREIYLIPMLNVDGNIYDREVFCPAPAWESCPSGGWRKNLRDNTYTGVTPLPDLNEEVDEDCDGVDLNRNYQFEWGAPLGATGPPQCSKLSTDTLVVLYHCDVVLLYLKRSVLLFPSLHPGAFITHGTPEAAVPLFHPRLANTVSKASSTSDLVQPVLPLLTSTTDFKIAIFVILLFVVLLE